MSEFHVTINTIKDIAQEEKLLPARSKYEYAYSIMPNISTTIIVRELCTEVCNLIERVEKLEAANKALLNEINYLKNK